MILGLGCDIVQVSRFSKNEAFLLRFIKKYFTFGEIAELEVRTTGQDLSRLVLAVGLQQKKPYQKLWEADSGKG